MTPTARRVAFWTAIAAGLVSAGVVIHEWRYRTDHPHALGPSGELIALGIVGLLISIAVLALTNVTVQEYVDNARRSHLAETHIQGLGDELKGELDRIREDALDDRLLLYLLHDTSGSDAWDKWERLVSDASDERRLDGVEPDEREEMELLLAKTRVLKLDVLDLRLRQVLDLARREDDDVHPEGGDVAG